MAQWNKDAQAFRAQDTTNFEVVMIADEDGNPINSFGAASNIPIAGGQIEGYNYVHKFGANTALATKIIKLSGMVTIFILGRPWILLLLH
jgi:hypothetical protein